MNRGKAIICDDDGVLRSIVSRILGDDGWEVVASVETAVEAIDLAGVLRPDLVVIDVSLRGMSGIDAIGPLVDGGASVIVCSAFAGSEESARRAGAVAVIDKSDLGTLADVLASLPTVSNA